MNSVAAGIFRSSLGKKYVMALTGAALFGFVIVHMLGNLQLFLGRDAINGYAKFLKSKPGLLWSARLGLLLLVILHIWAAIKLALENRAARSHPYSQTRWVAASYASRTMVWSGFIILAFVIYHLMHFTFGTIDANYLELRDPLGRHDVYRMMIEGFSHPLVSLFYIVAMGLLCLHLSHGVSSLFQSIGWRDGCVRLLVDWFARISALIIFIGNCSIPVAILFGYGK
jgi:succinate dehydrogenase / fumarate reductase cytochrome b subunit